MKKSKIIAIIITLFLIPALGIAASQKAKGNSTQAEISPEIQSSSAQSDTQDVDQPRLNTTNPKAKQKGITPSLTTQETTGEVNEDDLDNNDNDDEDNDDESGSINEKAIQRRSRVSNAVQTMLQISENNEGIGKQIRVIAQNQNKEMEKIEESLQGVKQRSKFLRFLIGPKYGQIDNIEERLEANSGRLEELRQLKDELPEEDAEILNAQILTMEKIKEELQSELNLEESGFTLFGWLVKLFN